jgi:hypothetical protein
MTCLFIYSIYLNLFQYHNVVAFYERLGFPEWLIYPSAVLKVLGLIAIYTRKSDMLKEWAYAGFFFDAILAFSAHQMAQDGQGIFAFIAAISVMVARIFEEKVFINKPSEIT